MDGLLAPPRTCAACSLLGVLCVECICPRFPFTWAPPSSLSGLCSNSIFSLWTSLGTLITTAAQAPPKLTPSFAIFSHRLYFRLTSTYFVHFVYCVIRPHVNEDRDFCFISHCPFVPWTLLFAWERIDTQLNSVAGVKAGKKARVPRTSRDGHPTAPEYHSAAPRTSSWTTSTVGPVSGCRCCGVVALLPAFPFCFPATSDG